MPQRSGRNQERPDLEEVADRVATDLVHLWNEKREAGREVEADHLAEAFPALWRANARVDGTRFQAFVFQQLQTNARLGKAIIDELGSLAATHEVLSILREWLFDDVGQMQITSANILGRMGEAAVTDEVISALRERLSDEASSVRRDATWALGQMGEAAATDEVLSNLRDWLSDEDPDVRQHAVQALGKMGEAAAVGRVLKTLVDILSDESKSSRSAKKSLCKIAPYALSTDWLRQLVVLQKKRSDEVASILRSLGLRLFESPVDSGAFLVRKGNRCLCRWQDLAALSRSTTEN